MTPDAVPYGYRPATPDDDPDEVRRNTIDYALAALDAIEHDKPMGWYCLSFADPDAGRLLGACVVEGYLIDESVLDDPVMGYIEEGVCVASAVRESHRLGINPGGAVEVVALRGTPRPDVRNRFLSRDELAAAELIEP